MHIKKKADDTKIELFFLFSPPNYTSLGMLKRQRIVSW